MAGKAKIHQALGGVVPVSQLAEWARETGNRPAFLPTEFQSRVTICPAQEIFLWGEKGSGKSGVSRLFIAKGNPDKPWFDRLGKPILVNQSYLYHPQYFAMVIRKNQADLQDWFMKFFAMVKPVWGGELVKDPWQYTSSYGATVVGGHMADDNSWMKYTGNEIHRLVWEEIVFMPSQEPYNFIKSVVRSAIPEIKQQILANCNPLGPGVGWLWPYFIETHNEQGDIVERPEGVPFVVSAKDTKTGEVYTSTRCHFFGKLSDNPHQDTPEYRAALLNQPEYIRDAYYFGKANRRGGTFFDNFRIRPNLDNNEPLNAQHVYPRLELVKGLRKWMPVTIGVDWGFGHECVITLGQVHPGEKRLYVLDGWSGVGVSTTEVGVKIGQMVKPYLASQSDSIVVALSPDAFSRESEVESEAKRIVSGIRLVIGDERIWLQDEDPLGTPDECKVHVVKAFDKRAMGWSQVYELFNFISVMPAGYEFNQAEAQKIYLDKGVDECNLYYKRWQDSMPQVLPRMLIASEIERLVLAIPKAMRDDKNPNDVVKKHWEGADWMDSLRYLVMQCRFQLSGEPGKVKMARQFDEAVEAGKTPHELLWLARWQEGQQVDSSDVALDRMNSPDFFGASVSLTLQ